ncbi:TIGR02391 family protein [Streptomyces ossamyceticus]|uniref:TIGR02391 family protein n=1 Tax=Streptomyces ossamyceticus TaxID=249581 RepID=UPI000B333AD5|nr:TIGR02391 family protein [Streptomyces ossamyceticus]
MQTRQAIQNLKQLKDEAQQEGLRLQADDKFSSWKGRVQSVLTRSLGVDHHLTQAFKKNRYSLMAFSTSTPDSAFSKAFLDGVKRACGLLDAAVFELEQAGTSDDAVDETAFDPDLWAHVQIHVQHENWQAVASQTAIFVEDRVRQWCGDPKDRDGRTLVGKGLFAKVLANDGQFRLGKEAGEWEGWRGIGMGFTQALGNVDRHNIQKRADAKRYAFGVLGVGSLILTQLRHQHSEDLTLDE